VPKIDFGLELLPSQSEWFERNVANLDSLQKYFSTLWISDHFQWFGNRPWYEGWTSLTYLAGRFPQFKLGNLVLSAGYRNPALLARMASTFQYLTGGRLILGIGAGWYKEEYEAYGYEFPPTYAERLERLAEAAEILKSMWNNSPATFEGKYYRIKDAYCEPKPKDKIPLLIGVGGNLRAMRVVAKYADMHNEMARVHVMKRVHENLVKACSEIGRDLHEIQLTSVAVPYLTKDLSNFKQKQEEHHNQLLGPDVDSVIKEMQQLVDMGVSHFQVRCLDSDSVAAFCEKVIPSFRD
jgi:alkanesulfonate monooxygenase SsuD/methylene tetrahydromethanopterin reductase-like flavin-dependent oxidoreductase (luciferase family)